MQKKKGDRSNNQTTRILDFGTDDSTTYYDKKKPDPNANAKKNKRNMSSRSRKEIERNYAINQCTPSRIEHLEESSPRANNIDSNFSDCPSLLRETIISKDRTSYRLPVEAKNCANIIDSNFSDSQSLLREITISKDRTSHRLPVEAKNCANIIDSNFSDSQSLLREITISKDRTSYRLPIEAKSFNSFASCDSDRYRHKSKMSSVFKANNNISPQSDSSSVSNSYIFDRYTSFEDSDHEGDSIHANTSEYNHASFNGLMSKSTESRSLLHECTKPDLVGNRISSSVRPHDDELPIFRAIESESTSETPLKLVNLTVKSTKSKSFPLFSQNITLEAAVNNDVRLTFCVNCSSFIVVPRQAERILCPNCNHIFKGIFSDNDGLLSPKIKGSYHGQTPIKNNSYIQNEPSERNDCFSECTLSEVLKPHRKLRHRIFRNLLPRLPFSKKSPSSRKNYAEPMKHVASSAVCLGTDSGIFKAAEGFSTCSESEIQSFTRELQKGVTVHVFNKSALRQKNIYLFHENLKYLLIGSPRNCFDLSECMEIRYGTSADGLYPDLKGTPMLRSQCEPEDLSKAFSIIFQKGTVDILTEDSEYCKFLARGFSALCIYTHIERLKKEYILKSTDEYREVVYL